MSTVATTPDPFDPASWTPSASVTALASRFAALPGTAQTLVDRKSVV
jgi:hypothetical protein